ACGRGNRLAHRKLTGSNLTTQVMHEAAVLRLLAATNGCDSTTETSPFAFAVVFTAMPARVLSP
ncbi:hypothetical protein, partial [Streptomyces sp. NPDC002346]